MKKLMLSVAIVCAAVMSQAATHKWKFGTGGAIVDGYNATSVGGSSTEAIGAGITAYLIYAGTATSTVTPVSQADLLTALRSGKTVTQAAGSALIKTSTTGANSYVTKTDEFSLDTDVFALDSDNKLNAYMVIVNDDGDYAYLTATAKQAYNDTVTPTIQPANVPSKFLRDDTGTAAYGTPGWYALAPEPTSGLMLLLGMGVLALRRRRA